LFFGLTASLEISEKGDADHHPRRIKPVKARVQEARHSSQIPVGRL
jgi:hypothetical protein